MTPTDHEIDRALVKQRYEITDALAECDPYGDMIRRIENAKTLDELRLIEDQLQFNKAFCDDERRAIKNTIGSRVDEIYGEMNAKAVGKQTPRWRNQS